MTPANSSPSESLDPTIETSIGHPAVSSEKQQKDPTDLTTDPTFVKLAMRNMVSKGSKSLFHFALTTVGLLGLLVGLAFVTR
jgi:Protein of unknown function (DUF3285)